MGNANVKTDKFQSAGVNDTSKMVGDFGRDPDKYPIAGGKNKPDVFIDKDGMLHIVLYDPDAVVQIEEHRHKLQGNAQNNEGAGYPDFQDELTGSGGIYIHESLSPPLDKVCPCKLDPNGICSPG